MGQSRKEADALLGQPFRGAIGVLHELLAEFGIGAITGDAKHVVEESFFGIASEIQPREFGVAQILQDRPKIVSAIVGKAHRTGAESAVAAIFLLRRALQHQDLGPSFIGGKRRT